MLAGEHKWEYWQIVVEKIRGLGLEDHIVCPDGISDDDLPALYQGAVALVHPSRYEGFGLQLAEAMAGGVPVLASDATSLPEVLGDCGLLFDPDDPTTIAFQMQRVYREPELRASFRARAGSVARGIFSWRKAAEQTLAVYEEVLGHAPSGQAQESGVGEVHRRHSRRAASLRRYCRALVLRAHQ